jgi:SAM-dependent methyltransferase
MNEITWYSHNWLALQINNNALKGVINNIRGRVVDLGCGTAQYKTDISSVADEYIGIDWENSLHDQSQVDIFANLCETLPLESRCADTVVSFQVLEHLPEPYIFLKEAYRILQPGGKIIITAPFMWHVHEAPYDYYRFTRYGLQYLLNKAGFIDIAINENTGYWQTSVLKFNYYTTRLARGPLRLLFIPLWYAGQILSPFLDKLHWVPTETASYTVIAKKP